MKKKKTDDREVQIIEFPPRLAGNVSQLLVEQETLTTEIQKLTAKLDEKQKHIAAMVMGFLSSHELPESAELKILPDKVVLLIK